MSQEEKNYELYDEYVRLHELRNRNRDLFFEFLIFRAKYQKTLTAWCIAKNFSLPQAPCMTITYAHAP